MIVRYQPVCKFHGAGKSAIQGATDNSSLTPYPLPLIHSTLSIPPYSYIILRSHSPRLFFGWNSLENSYSGNKLNQFRTVFRAVVRPFGKHPVQHVGHFRRHIVIPRRDRRYLCGHMFLQQLCGGIRSKRRPAG